MPQDPRTIQAGREARARSSFDLYDEDAEDIPDVQLGTTVVNMRLEHSVVSGRGGILTVPSTANSRATGEEGEVNTDELRVMLGLPVKLPKAERGSSSRAV